MLENIAIEIAEELNNAGINAVTAFNASELEDVSAFVCVGLKSARISSSGLGNYIGVCTEDGQLKEMYGEKAELVLSFDVYSPASADEGCSELADGVRCALFNIDGLSVTEFDFEKSNTTATAACCAAAARQRRQPILCAKSSAARCRATA